ncbi:hypothetical protein M0812_00192 [Anaeramoeba flamelloides]|uniref:E2F/DP family winged-helix DNA-binding domain-containing protein n=1 Tax=Anaeramoeba flamelloides TaxID=1746091 RepID=A0AAV8A4R8_9EUKA|nr:hypothetical protein M0812_00192 [Anaeramoeba flamelloides]
MSLKKEIPYFYTLVWDFGDYLVRTFNDQEEFQLEGCVRSFIDTNLPNKNKNIKDQMEKALYQVCKLFSQNSIFVLPDQAHPQKNKTKKSVGKQISPNYDHLKNNFVLNPIWRSILLKTVNQPIETTRNSLTVPLSTVCTHNNNKDQVSKSNRSEKTIGILTFKICKRLLKGPSTREELQKETGFIKQRIRTVLSIYKAIDLVSEDNSTHHIKWNGYQAKVITDSQKYINHLIKLRNQKRLLAKKLTQVLAKFETKVQNDQFNQKHFTTSRIPNQLRAIHNRILPLSKEKVSQILFSNKLNTQSNITQQTRSVLKLSKKITVHLRNLQMYSTTNHHQLSGTINRTTNTKKKRKNCSRKKRRVSQKKSIKLKIKKVKTQSLKTSTRNQEIKKGALNTPQIKLKRISNFSKISEYEKDAINAILSLTKTHSNNTQKKPNNSSVSTAMNGNFLHNSISIIPLLLLITQEN